MSRCGTVATREPWAVGTDLAAWAWHASDSVPGQRERLPGLRRCRSYRFRFQFPRLDVWLVAEFKQHISHRIDRGQPLGAAPESARLLMTGGLVVMPALISRLLRIHRAA